MNTLDNNISLELQKTPQYNDWLNDVKERIKKSRIRASIAANTEFISFYWGLGKDISEKVNTSSWGSKVIDLLAHDLKTEFPDMNGFSRPNLYFMKRLYEFYSNNDYESLFVSQPVTQIEPSEINKLVNVSHPVKQMENINKAIESEFINTYIGLIPWGHNRIIISHTNTLKESIFYIQQTIEHGWSRDILEMQIKSDLYNRQGKAISNFKYTLPNTASDLVTQLIKDPYRFDFLAMTENYKERELENALIDNVSKFLLELGTGFAYVGRQVPMKVDNQEYYIDLLFYHLKLRCYVIIELKATDFMPEYAGKLSFYLSAANDIFRHPTDNPTIGLMICKNKNNIIAEYALKNINQPIGVSEYQLTKLFPNEFKSSLPSIDVIEAELKKLDIE